MTETCYPVFQEGQTLTRDDLNRLRAFLDDRDRGLGRAIGFGINCGLGGEVQEDGLHISPGIAVDQRGEVIVLPAGVVIPLPPIPAESFEFVDGAEGVTAVLVAAEVEIAAPECDEEGCEAHASLTCRTASVVLDDGRLTGTRFDFASEPLLSVEPLRIRPASTVEGPFVALREAILGRVGDRLAADARAKLAGLRIESSDLPAIKAYKAAFLNHVLFAALDYLRCSQLVAFACLRTTETPGVALGWLHQVGGAWEWDCNWRHAWEPPSGFSQALVGGRCDDPCGLYLDRLEGMILTFEVPVVPAPEDPPDPGPIDPFPWCRRRRHPGDRWGIIDLEDCGIVVYPPEKLPEDWPEIYVNPPWDPGYVDPIPPWVNYGTDPPEWLESGVLDLSPGFGHEGPRVAGALRERISEGGVEPDVRVLTRSEATSLEGYEPAAAVSPSDVVVIVVDELGKVEATGHVSAGRALRNAGTAIPRVEEASGRAVEAANAAAGKVDTLGGRVDVIDDSIASFGEFRTELSEWRLGADEALSTLDERMAFEADKVLAEYKATLGPMLDNAILDATEKVRGGVLEQSRAEITAGIASVGERVKALETKAQSHDRDIIRGNERVDQILAGRAAGLTADALTRNVEFNTDLVEFLGATRRALVASASEGEPRRKVEETLAASEEAFTRLDAQARAGALILPQESEALRAVVDSMVGAARAAGAPRAELTELRRTAETLSSRLR
jgi:hypothetical protein